MANFYGTNTTSIISSVPSDGTKLDAQIGDKVRCATETITLSAAINSDGTSAQIYFARIPSGSRFLKVEVSSTVSLGTSTLAVTDGTTTWAPAKAYGTTADAVVAYADADYVGDEFTAETDLYFTVGTAALPSSGEVKAAVYYTTPN